MSVTSVDITFLTSAAENVTEITVDPITTIVQIGDAVDPGSGLPMAIEPSLLRHHQPGGIAEYLVSHTAGDCAFAVCIGARPAFLIRPPFSEVEVYYRRSASGAVSVWAGTALPGAHEAADPLDWGYLHASLHNPTLITARTGLAEVRELLSGAVLDCRSGLAQTDHLHRLVAQLDTPPADFEELVERYRSTILASVAHKTTRHAMRTGIAASGGLDSSVVAIAAARCHPDQPLPLINARRDDDETSDERDYFDALVHALPNSRPVYVETSDGVAKTDLAADSFLPAPRPCKIAAAASMNMRVHASLAERGCDRLISGDGGDQLFLRLSRPALAPELLAEAEGVRAKWHVLINTASFQHTSIYTTIRGIRTPTADTMHWRNMFGDLAFPTSRLAPLQPASTDIVPHADMISRWPLSRAFQYVALRNAEMNRIALATSNVSERKAVLFWPLVRLSLSTARTMHLHRGVDRAIERALFPELPVQIARRMGKGGGRDVATRYDYPALAKRLLDSELVRRGILDSGVLESLAEGDSPMSVDDTQFTLIRAAVTDDWITRVTSSR